VKWRHLRRQDREGKLTGLDEDLHLDDVLVCKSMCVDEGS
jgi:hypothetical protein